MSSSTVRPVGLGRREQLARVVEARPGQRPDQALVAARRPLRRS